MKHPAEVILGELLQLASHAYVPALDIASVSFGSGDVRAVMERVAKAADEHGAWLLWLDTDPQTSRVSSSLSLRRFFASGAETAATGLHLCPRVSI